MSDRINVLAVLAAQQKNDEIKGLWEPAAVMEEVRYIVAELIEAAEEVAGTITEEPEPDSAMARLDAALARIGED